MTLIQLEYILAIAQHGSFVEAANHCNVTQPALTTQVKNLEKELDMVIFDRTRKPIVPTEVGVQIIEQAQEVVAQFKKIPDIVGEFNAEIKGDLSIGIIPTVSPYLIPYFIGKFAEYRPQVNLNVKEVITEDIIHKLKTGALDAGIIATPVDTKGIIAIPLYYEKFFGYVSKNHFNFFKENIKAKDLKLEELWLLKEGNCFRDQIINICSRKQEEEFHNNFRYESHSIESLKRIVEVTDGMTLIPELAADIVPKDKQEMIKEISDLQPTREISLVVSRQFLKKRLIDGIKEAILDSIPEHMLQNKNGKIIDTNIRI